MPQGQPPRRRLVVALTLLAAPALILAGGLWHQFGTVQARQTLRWNEPVRRFQGYALPGFEVELAALQPDFAKPVYQLIVASREAVEVQEGQGGTLPGGFPFAIDKLLPAAQDQGQVRDNPAAPENPALRVLLGVGAPEPLVGTLFAQSASDRYDDTGGRFAVVFRDAWSEAVPASLGPQPARSEALELGFLGGTFTHPAAAGGTWAGPGFRLKVVRAFPDFAVRPDERGQPQPYSKTDLPRDPWLEVAFDGSQEGMKRVLLSARNPELTDSLNAPNLPQGLTLRYLRPGEDRQARFVVITREDRKLRLVEDHAVRRVEPLSFNHPFIVAAGLSVTPLELFNHAEILHEFVPRPGAPAPFERPALRLKVSDPGHGLEQSLWLDGRVLEGKAETHLLFEGRLRLAFHRRPLEQADWKPVLTIRDQQGRQLARQEIDPKHPFRWAGHAFLLPREPPPGPGEITLALLREPGLELIYLGCTLLLLGLLWLFLVAPGRN